jgi:peptidoglycan/xylan/chitin deacetylase (PgdA/CDA1 family)
MKKAFAVKGLAVAAALAAVSIVPSEWGVTATALIVVITIGFLTHAVMHPRSQFFVPVVSRLPTDDPSIALTFDDGPDPVFTPQILDVLRAHRARATFFVLGDRARRHPDLIRRMHREGHTVGTHTQNHTLRFHFGSPSYVQREIEDAVVIVKSILNARPKLFRPPQGLRTPFFASGWQRMNGLTCVTWSVRGLDSPRTTARAIVSRIERHLEPGAIVTLHDGTGLGGGHDRKPTLEALSVILSECQSRGLRCVPLSDVMAAEC